MFVYNI